MFGEGAARGRHAARAPRSVRCALPPVDQPRRRAVQRPRRRARPLAGRGRIGLQGRQGSRPQPARDLSGKRRQHHPPLHRHQRRDRRARRARREPPAPRCADDPAVRRRARTRKPHYELLLRMIDPDGNTIGPDRFLSAALRYQLMPTIDRWVITSVIELLRPRRELLANAPVRLHHQFLRPVAARRGIRRLRDPQHRDQPHQPGGVLLRAHRERGRRQHQRRRGADAAPAQAGLRRRARRFRHRPVVAVLPALDAGVACSRSTAASCATS